MADDAKKPDSKGSLNGCTLTIVVALQGFGNFASFTARLKSGVERRLLPWVTTCVAFRGPTGSLSTHCAIGRRSIGLFKGYPAAQASTASKY